MFDTNHVTKYFVEIGSVRYSKDGVLTNFPENSYFDQYRDLKLFYKEYVGEDFLQPCISYPDMKNFYQIKLIILHLRKFKYLKNFPKILTMKDCFLS